MGLARSLQPWAILLIYCNNQLKKYMTPLLALVRGALSIPLLMSVSEAFSVPFYTLIKLCYTKALEWSSLVPRPKVKSSSLEITNLTFHHKLSPSSRGSSWPRDWTTSGAPDLQVDSLLMIHWASLGKCLELVYSFSHLEAFWEMWTQLISALSLFLAEHPQLYLIVT